MIGPKSTMVPLNTYQNFEIDDTECLDDFFSKKTINNSFSTSGTP